MKTADEMFREIGYERVKDWLPGPKDFCYMKKQGGRKKTTYRIIIDGDLGMVDCQVNRETVPLTFQETIACAQLIKEMEENNG